VTYCAGSLCYCCDTAILLGLFLYFARAREEKEKIGKDYNARTHTAGIYHLLSFRQYTQTIEES